MKFEIIKTDKKARAGLLSLHENKVETPTFMPVATRGTINSTPHEYLNKTSIFRPLNYGSMLATRTGAGSKLST